MLVPKCDTSNKKIVYINCEKAKYCNIAQIMLKCVML